MISWENWQTLLAVYRTGTYVSAAEVLGVNATTIGRRIRHLETRLGGALFSRNDRKLTPTARCSELLASLEAASELLREVEHSSLEPIPGLIWREVRITAAPFLVQSLLAPHVLSLTEEHRLRIEIVGTGEKISLTRREADIALRLDDGYTPLVPTSELVHQEKLGLLDFAIFASTEADPETLPWAVLSDAPGRTIGTQLMQELARPETVQFQTTHFEGLQALVRAGAAKALLPEYMAKADPRLTAVSDTRLSVPLLMQTHVQDKDIAHLEAARYWVKATCEKIIKNCN